MVAAATSDVDPGTKAQAAAAKSASSPDESALPRVGIASRRVIVGSRVDPSSSWTGGGDAPVLAPLAWTAAAFTRRDLAAKAAPSLTSIPLASIMVNPNAQAPTVDRGAIATAVVAYAVGLGVSALREFGIATFLGRTQPTVNQSLVVNGYELVPSSTEVVSSFYGQWTFWPGGPTFLQGQQNYSVVDPSTGRTVGTFDAKVSTGSPLNIRSKYVGLLVTANDGINVGAAPGQTPPVGSLLANFTLIGGFGCSYTAMPSPTDPVISLKLTTPFGNIPLPVKFNAAEGIADHTVISPIDLGNGYSIVPAGKADQTYVGTAGFLPLFSALQARAVFDVRNNHTGATAGSFEGVVTPTADIFGVRTEAILVTANQGIDVGTAAGQIPPVGSVFNHMLTLSGQYLYSSLPDPFGDVVSTIRLGPGSTVTNIATFPLNLLNASEATPVKRLPTAGGYSFLPTSPFTPTGVNGLPPRDIQIQGHQQFGVYDSDGILRGTFEADVATQRDFAGTNSQALLVTKVLSGTSGTAKGDVPPVGSVFNYVFFGKSGLGTFSSAMPSPSGAKTAFKFLTPIVGIPTWSTYDASEGLADVVFADHMADSRPASD